MTPVTESALVLAKAYPVVSKKYEELVCVAGITSAGQWRRLYPIPWGVFWKNKDTKFKKKSWISYELKDVKPSDHRPESRKINYETIQPGREENWSTIKKMLDERITNLEALTDKSHTEVSLGIIKPRIIDFFQDEKRNYDKYLDKKAQMTLFGTSAVRIDIPDKIFGYEFYCSESCKKPHRMMCEDWEVGQLYRHCEEYRKKGKEEYSTEDEVFQKVKQKMMSFKDMYFVVGTHFRFGTYVIVGIIYPKKNDL